MDPGWYPTAGSVSGLIFVGTVNIWCTKLAIQSLSTMVFPGKLITTTYFLKPILQYIGEVSTDLMLYHLETTLTSKCCSLGICPEPEELYKVGI